MSTIAYKSTSFIPMLKDALASGCTQQPVTRHNMAGDCTNPFVQFYTDGNWSNAIERSFRCRKCDNCKRKKQGHWFKRALIELHAYTKCWFVTFTFKPSIMNLIIAKASINSDFEKHSPDVKSKSYWSQLVKYSGEYVTKFLKRLRHIENFRYLIIAEPHKSGLPHWHGLIYGWLNKRDLQGVWSYGFSDCTLVKDEKSISYVLKYISKTEQVRIRSSLHFGKRKLQTP